jgi:hypothetical protein
MFLLIVNIIIGLLFLALGIFITEKNALSVISTYDQKKNPKDNNFKLPEFVKFFKQFHYFLGTSMIFLSIIFKLFWGQDAQGMLLGFYPILGYIYFTIKARTFYSGSERTIMNISLWVLIITSILIGALLVVGNSKSEMQFAQNQVEITGMYGQIIPYSEINILKLENEMPDIRLKTNGFALETVKKGYFKLKNGEKVKLIFNTLSLPLIYIELKNGKKIYYSDTKESNLELFKKLSEKSNTP